jgi:hypothetical protein
MSGSPIEILQCGTTLFWGPRDRLRLWNRNLVEISQLLINVQNESSINKNSFESTFLCTCTINLQKPPGTPASSTTKTGPHDIAEILLKVALSTINQSINQFYVILFKCSLFLITLSGANPRRISDRLV